MKKKLLAIDGNSILNRAFYGVRPLSTKDGFPTNALYGMVNMIMRQAEAIAPDYVKVEVVPHHGGDGFLIPISSPAYKAAEKAMTDST